VQEFHTPLSIDLPGTGNLTDDVVVNARSTPDMVSFSRKVGTDWVDVTAADFLTQVTRIAKGLVAAGIEPGERIALLSRTRYEWTLFDYAIWFAGAVTVPIYETSSPDLIAWIVGDSEARAVVIETAEHEARVKSVQSETDAVQHVWSIEANAVDTLSTLGADVADRDLEARRSALTPDSVATIIYTSGTTGRPKGCVLTHGNFMFELGVGVDQLRELFEMEGSSTLLFLPLAHVFARIIQIGAVKGRSRLGHASDPKRLLEELDTFKPTFILSVPRVFEKVFNTAAQKATAEGHSRIFERATATAIAYSRALERGRPGLALRLQHALFDRLVYRKLRAALGGRCEYAVSGGAPLGERLGHFYRGIGLHVLEGYGLTETTAASTVNLPEATKIGTAGRPLAGTSVRIADDGEILLKGRQVFRGYWRNEEATRKALDTDGWLHTGDLGDIDEDGYLHITGRKKELLVTAGGKNVAPAPLEDLIRSHPLVSQCMVVGDGKPFIAALVTLDPEALPAWAEAHGKAGSPAVLAEDLDLLAEIQGSVDEANRTVSQAESIKKFAILPRDWTEEGGQLTPSLKLKRAVVMREFRDAVEALYR
jgi:long-chain acyl-CoA synthetase